VTAGDYVRLLTLMSGAVLAWSSWKQYEWQLTQTKRDAEAEEAREQLEAASRPTPKPEEAAAAETPEAKRQKEKLNAAKLRHVAAQNAARPFFDKKAYMYFLAGFLLSVAGSVIDIVSNDTLSRLLGLIVPG
jgi:hypothetical protein